MTSLTATLSLLAVVGFVLNGLAGERIDAWLYGRRKL